MLCYGVGVRNFGKVRVRHFTSDSATLLTIKLAHVFLTTHVFLPTHVLSLIIVKHKWV